METKIIFATGNQAKMKEIRMILADLGMPILSMKEAGIDIDVVEDGTTFQENAAIKADFIRNQCNIMAIADDSGLEVDYLNKEPGVYSARYLGEDTPQEEKNAYILKKNAIVFSVMTLYNRRKRKFGAKCYEQNSTQL